MDILTFALILIIYFTSLGTGVYFYREYLKTNKEKDNTINKVTSFEAELASINEQLKKYDDRVNNTWEIVSGVKQSIETLKLQFNMNRSKI